MFLISDFNFTKVFVTLVIAGRRKEEIALDCIRCMQSVKRTNYIQCRHRIQCLQCLQKDIVYTVYTVFNVSQPGDAWEEGCRWRIGG